MTELSRHIPASTPTQPGDARLDDDGASPVFKDVWSRSGSRYRIRAIVLLAVNVLLFAGLCSFAFWLRSGVRFAPLLDGYWEELSHAGSSIPMLGRSGVSLGTFLLEPISAQAVPMQIPIWGLLMAALIAIPILVSMLYRFASSLPFIAAVGFLAVMPWLAATLLVSCVIASVSPFRTRFRFVSALLGLVPVVVYLFMAWSGTAEVIVGRIDPLDRIKFISPWALAVIAAAVVSAVVLTIAKLVDYRPGAIAPLLAVMFGLPMVLFEFYVGRDELYYRLLESTSTAHFSDVDASVPLEQQVELEWARRPAPRGSRTAVREAVELRWLFQLNQDVFPDRSALSRHQMDIVDRCDWFVKHFPRSRYANNALYLRAKALDTRVDPEEFRRTNWVRFYDDFPSVASGDTWRMLSAQPGHSILHSVAALRLAALEARDGHVDRAIDQLVTMLHDMDADSHRTDGSDVGKSVLGRGLPESSLRIPRERVVLEAHRLHDLLARNNDPIYGYDPLCGSRFATDRVRFGLLDLLPRSERYAENLKTISAQYPKCELQDNIAVEIAKSASTPTARAAQLAACLDDFPDGDAAAEALFRLGIEYKELDQPRESAVAFTRLFAVFPGSIWARQAVRYAPESLRLAAGSG